MPSSCAAAHCDHKYTQTANVSFHKSVYYIIFPRFSCICQSNIFHRFPLHKPHILQKWIAFANRDPAWQPSRWSSICSRHFLANDFRGHTFQKKYLKPLAIPTVTIKKLEFNTFDLNMNDNYHFASDDQANRTHEQFCRLCARVESIEDTSTATTSSIDDPLTASNIAKCLPTIIQLDASDQFPKKVCAECLTKIQQFSLFVDIVADVQTYFLQQPFRSRDEQSTGMVRQTGITFSNSVAAIKPVIIKQEPIVKVKQEVMDSFRTSTTAKAAVVPVDLFPENDAFCEFCDVYFINNVELKNHIVNYHSDNSREVPNNCEIMEIITLENAFVDLADNCVDDEYDHQIMEQATEHSENNYHVPLEHVLKVEHLNDYEHREQLRVLNAIQNDHSYAQISSNGVFIPLNESGLKQEPSSAIHNLTDTSFKVFESSTSDDQGLDDVSEKKTCDSKNTRTCSICLLKCKSVYHLLVHNKKHQRAEVRRSLKKRRCYDCKSTFTSKLALKNHKRLLCNVRKSLICPVCQANFLKLVLLRIHMKLCPKRDALMFIDQQPLHSEEVIHFETEATSTINEVHERFNKSTNSELGVAAVRPLQNGRYACDQCSRTYGRRSNLVRNSHVVFFLSFYNCVKNSSIVTKPIIVPANSGHTNALVAK